MDDAIPVLEELDHMIVMHRDAHFGGSFDMMLEYYEKEGRGVHPEFSIEKIKQLRSLEKKLGQNLGVVLLSEQEMHQVALAREKYYILRDLYEKKLSIPRLIADLILTEEDPPLKEIEAIIEKGDECIPALLNLIETEEFYDSLFPGYGQTPLIAIRCLGHIGNDKAIVPLFQAMGKEYNFDEAILDAFVQIGEPAKEFLLKVVQSKPISKENENAIIALLHFPEEIAISSTCLHLLQTIACSEYPIFATYLIFGCSALVDPLERKQFSTLSKQSNLPQDLAEEIETIQNNWTNPS